MQNKHLAREMCKSAWPGQSLSLPATKGNQHQPVLIQNALFTAIIERSTIVTVGSTDVLAGGAMSGDCTSSLAPVGYDQPPECSLYAMLTSRLSGTSP